MSPVEQAALLSACYDGHEGTIGNRKDIVGIRTADPSMPVSMGGLAGATRLALDNVWIMREWFAANRERCRETIERQRSVNRVLGEDTTLSDLSRRLDEALRLPQSDTSDDGMN